jgi:hypothetical protein
MKRIMFFIFSFTVSMHTLKSMVPTSPEQNVPTLPEFQAPATSQIVPYAHHYTLRLPRRTPLLVSRAFQSLHRITPEIMSKVESTLNKAHKLIIHGQQTGQLSLSRKKDTAIREALAMQLIELDISGVDEEGYLDRALTTLSDFFIENRSAYHIAPFAEEDDAQTVPKKRKPLRRKLLLD